MSHHLEPIDGGYRLTVDTGHTWDLVAQWQVVDPATRQVVVVCSTVQDAVDLFAGATTNR